MAIVLSISKAAEVLGVCTKTLRRWDQRGLLKPDFRTKGGHRRYIWERLIK
ncbi:MAG: MerR family DNA-binding transcriptional regulator [Promethearchaeota archaeon]